MPTPPLAVPEVSIQLFGHLCVRAACEPIQPLHSRRGLWLLALLALHSRAPVERTFLAGMLWPDSPEATSLHNLRQTLSDLRRALGPAAGCLLSDTFRTLRLDLPRVHVDLIDFDRALADGGVPNLERAAQLYTGPLLAGCDEPWAIEGREIRARAYLELLERLAADRAAAEDFAGASHWLRLASAADPYHEPVHRGLIQSLAAAGELTAATEVYRSMRIRLHRDLNTEPDPITTAAFRAIREHRFTCLTNTRTALTSSRVRTVPAPTTRLIGRDHDCMQLLNMLDRSRCVTITGVGGIGKTRLALYVAREIERDTEHNVIFVGLAALSNSTAIADTILGVLGIAACSTTLESNDVLKRCFLQRSVVLVLDNCEHLLPACAALADDLLCHCENLRIMVTSRHPLGLSSELVWLVPSLALPACGGFEHQPMLERGSSELAATCAAVELFVQRANAVQCGFRLTRETAPIIEDICRRLDGIPLAIELAAARVRSLSLGEIDARLKFGIGILSSGGSTLVARHKTLAAAFDWSWDLLSEPERVLLQRLAVFIGGWTLTAAEAICCGNAVATDDIVDLLTGLVDKSLVVFSPQDQGSDWDGRLIRQPRYHLLEPVRQYVVPRLRASGEEDAVRINHRDHFIAYAETVKPKLYGTGQEMWFDQLELEHDNMRAALRYCSCNPNAAEHEIRLVVALARLWDTRGHLREGREHIDAAIARMTPQLPFDLRLGILVHAGWIASVQKDNRAAKHYYGLSLDLLTEADKQSARADVLGFMALVESDNGDFSEARTLLEAALALHRKLGSGRLGSTLNNLGWVELQVGNSDAARTYLEESAYYCEHIERAPQQLAITLCNLADVNLQQRHYEAAESNCVLSIRLSRDCGAVINIPDTIDHLCLIARSCEQWRRAATLLGVSATMRDSMGLPEVCAAHIEALSAVENALGTAAFEHAVSEGRRMDIETAIAFALSNHASMA